MFLDLFIKTHPLGLCAHLRTVQPCGEVDPDIFVVNPVGHLAVRVVALNKLAVELDGLPRELVASRRALDVLPVLLVVRHGWNGRPSPWHLPLRLQLVEVLVGFCQLEGELLPEGHVHLGVDDVGDRREHPHAALEHGGGALLVLLPKQQRLVHLRQLLQDPHVLGDPAVHQKVLQRLAKVVVGQPEDLSGGLEGGPDAGGLLLRDHGGVGLGGVRGPLLFSAALNLCALDFGCHVCGDLDDSRFTAEVEEDRICPLHPPLYPFMEPPEMNWQPHSLVRTHL
mmetsp:Transcript_14768/g.45631  ORF Transcript_14768/g.45631 Transcript_14768/m.45631 type:complete len:282 (+) Transcript_14768:253-1098(+)